MTAHSLSRAAPFRPGEKEVFFFSKIWYNSASLKRGDPINRITTKAPDGSYTAEDTDAAVNLLGRYETMAEELLAEQETLSAELAGLRALGQTRTYHFKEKMARKLNNAAVIDRLNSCHLL